MFSPVATKSGMGLDSQISIIPRSWRSKINSWIIEVGQIVTNIIMRNMFYFCIPTDIHMEQKDYLCLSKTKPVPHDRPYLEKTYFQTI
jgi:hypothetical protein